MKKRQYTLNPKTPFLRSNYGRKNNNAVTKRSMLIVDSEEKKSNHCYNITYKQQAPTGANMDISKIMRKFELNRITIRYYLIWDIMWTNKRLTKMKLNRSQVLEKPLPTKTGENRCAQRRTCPKRYDDTLKITNFYTTPVGERILTLSPWSKCKTPCSAKESWKRLEK